MWAAETIVLSNVDNTEQPVPRSEVITAQAGVRCSGNYRDIRIRLLSVQLGQDAITICCTAQAQQLQGQRKAPFLTASATLGPSSIAIPR